MIQDTSALVTVALATKLDELRDQIHHEVEGMTDAEFWRKPLDPGNSCGHLVLHLTGNLKHFVGAQLGGSGYIRDRQREFSEANPPSKLGALSDLDGAVAEFRRVVTGLSAERLAAPHPNEEFGSVLQALVHLVSHFALHRGQITYIVRMVRREGFV